MTRIPNNNHSLEKDDLIQILDALRHPRYLCSTSTRLHQVLYNAQNSTAQADILTVTSTEFDCHSQESNQPSPAEVTLEAHVGPSEGYVLKNDQAPQFFVCEKSHVRDTIS